MIFNKSLGDKYGCSSLGTPSIGGHYRPIISDYCAGVVVQPSVLDNVRTTIGKTGNDGVFLDFQLSCNQCKREE